MNAPRPTLLEIRDASHINVSHSVFMQDATDELTVEPLDLADLTKMHWADETVRTCLAMLTHIVDEMHDNVSDVAVATVLAPVLSRMSAAEIEAEKQAKETQRLRADAEKVDKAYRAARTEMERRYSNKPLPAELFALFELLEPEASAPTASWPGYVAADAGTEWGLS